MSAFIEHAFIKENTIEARDYQASLAKSVIEKGSSLIVAPTALGKTVVAAIVIAEMLAQKKGRVLFLAPTKPLVQQHSNTLKKLLKVEPEKIATITGTIKARERKQVFDSALIVCSTPQCTRNDLAKKRISLEGFALAVFDEAHRAVGDYAYVDIAKAFNSQNPLGLVLGMTASPGHERKKIEEVANNLFVKNFEIKTLEDSDVAPYVKKVNLEWRLIELPKEFEKISLLLQAYLKKNLSDLKQAGLAPTDNPKYFSRKRILDLQAKVSERIKSHGHKAPFLYAIASKIACTLMASHALLLIETQGPQALNDYFEKNLAKPREGKTSRALSMFLKDERIKHAIVETRKVAVEGTEHSKLTELKKIVSLQFEENPFSRIIVFNHYRDSVAFVAGKLKELPKARVQQFIGQASKGKSKGLSQKEQAEIIKKFEEGEYNVLVATSVAEEGLDIPACDLVVFYEPVPSEIRHIQRRGRTGRIKKGRAIILMAKGTRDEAFYWSAKRKEGKMTRTLKRLQSKTQELQTKLGDFNARN
ncbi:MAG: helicase-related protein [Candidatus Diapherotrites archaeon]